MLSYNSHQTYGSVALRWEKHIMVAAVVCWAVLGLVIIFDQDYSK